MMSDHTPSHKAGSETFTPVDSVVDQSTSEQTALLLLRQGINVAHWAMELPNH